MRILLCNDDGIQAPGLHALQNAVKDLGEIHVIAPDRERSAISHGITLTKPLRTALAEPRRHLRHRRQRHPPTASNSPSASSRPKPDLILSGINLGPTPASAYSTPAPFPPPPKAPSWASRHRPLAGHLPRTQLETAARVSRHLVEQVISGQFVIPPETFWNVNIPNRPYDQLAGLRITRMGASRFVEKYERREDPWGNPYYWMNGELYEKGEMAGTDLEALRENYVSLSPIGLDRTAHAALDTLRPAPNSPMTPPLRPADVRFRVQSSGKIQPL